MELLRIKNIEASTLLEYNLGIRDHFEYKNAVFADSLFYDYIVENKKFNVKNDSTRDIICLEFNYGCRGYNEEIAHINKHLAKAKNMLEADNYLLKYSEDGEIEREKVARDAQKQERKIEKFSSLLTFVEDNKEKYIKLSTDAIRHKLYNEGVCVYYTDGRGKQTKIYYKMLYRSVGKSKKGSCMFIKDSLYEDALNFLRMGIKLPEKNAMVVEIGAYSPLVSSGIEDRVQIDPDSILVLKDVDRFFTTNIISVETDSNGDCIAKPIKDYTLKNTLFDGQALIDESIFPKNANGYVLLRHHFFKAAAFCTKIQKFFRDYCRENGLDYGTQTVTDMFGRRVKLKDIRLVTTDNALKWIKFGVSYEYWSEWVRGNGSLFGIVKSAHPSKIGDGIQRMSYQMVNSMPMAGMEEICRESKEYVKKLKEDDGEFLKYLEKNQNFINDFEVLVALVRHNKDFINSSYFRERRSFIIRDYIVNMKSGRLIQNADNLVIVGSPFAMLLYAATGDSNSVDGDGSFGAEDGAIQCYTEMFKPGEYLAGFRSPFNSKNNLDYLHNILSPDIKKYFVFGKQIIAVNMVGTDFQDRNNGSDQDSDSLYVTNQRQIVEHAKMCVRKYPTIVNNIPKDTRTYDNTPDNFATIDTALSASQRDIGEASNLAQLAQTYSYTFPEEHEKYDSYVCILSVLAQVAIDSSKRRYDTDISENIKRIKKEIGLKKNGYPAFWSIVKKEVKPNDSRINSSLICPMNYLCDLQLNYYHRIGKRIPVDKFFINHKLNVNRRKCRKVENLISHYSLNVYNTVIDEEDRDQIKLLYLEFEELVQEIKRIYISKNYIGLMAWLINRSLRVTEHIKYNTQIKTIINKNRPLLLKVLYTINPDNFLKCFIPGDSDGV